MRVLMFTWEWPPVMHGGLGRHVVGLAEALTARGVAVTVVAPRGDAAPGESWERGVRVVRAVEDPYEANHVATSLPPRADFLVHVLSLNSRLARAALALLAAGEEFDVMHAHDWVVAHAALTVRAARPMPLLTTVHATEAGRHAGWLPGDFNRTVHTTEWWLVRASDGVVVCSAAMAMEARALFDVDPDRVTIIPNAIDLAAWAHPRAPDPDPNEIGVVSRLEHEKGVQHVVAAVALLRRRHPDLVLTIVGTGTFSDDLVQEARRLKLGSAVRLTGREPDTEVRALLARAAAIVVPSLYEPFGIVALEAGAARAPLVVTDSGGLRDIVVDGMTGRVVPSGSPEAIAAALEDVLSDPQTARQRAEAGYQRVLEQFTWPVVAQRTEEVYARTVERVAAKGVLPAPTGAITVPRSNLLSPRRPA